jgi:5-methylthioadenosine/S-adenosylhomocysteine deaminase
MTDFLLKDATVLTLGNRTQNHESADVLIEDGLVSEVGSGLRARSAEVIEAEHTIVMPGFVDTHRRCWPSLFKNEGAIPTGAAPGPDDVYAGTFASLAGAAESGITTVVDWYDGPADASHVEAALRAHADSGLRTVLVLAPEQDAPTFWREIVSGASVQPGPLTTLAAGLISLTAAGPTSLAAARADAADLGLRLHVRGDGAAAGHLAAASGALGGDVTIVHCNGLDDADLDAISSSGAGVALTPVADMTFGPGAPPMQAILDRNIRPGLGVGDELEGPGDLLAQIRSAISIQHATYFDLKLAGKGGLPNLLTTRDVIRYGTSDGANAIGLSDVAGSIEPGKPADLIVLRTDTPNLFPVNDPIGAVVWGVDTSNLDWVFVGGRPVMREGVLEADIPGVRNLVTDARQRMGVPTRGLSDALAGGDA